MTKRLRDGLERAWHAIRVLNDHNIEAGRLTVTDTCVMVDELGAIASELDQALTLLARNLDQRVEADQLRHDSGGHPTETVLSAAAKLRTASHQIAETAYLIAGAAYQLVRIADLAPLAHDPIDELDQDSNQ